MNQLTKRAGRRPPGILDWVIVLASLVTLSTTVAWAIYQWVVK